MDFDFDGCPELGYIAFMLVQAAAEEGEYVCSKCLFVFVVEIIKIVPKFLHGCACFCCCKFVIDTCVAEMFFDDMLDGYVSFHEYCAHVFVCLQDYVFWVVNQFSESVVLQACYVGLEASVLFCLFQLQSC